MIRRLDLSRSRSWQAYSGISGRNGAKRWSKATVNSIYCLFIVVGCTTQLDAVLDFTDAMIFAMALANVTGMYLLAPVVAKELDAYWSRVKLERGT